MEIHERIFKVFDHYDLTAYKASQEFNVSNAVLSKIKHGQKPNIQLIENIIKKYNDLNPVWLITGQGEMILQQWQQIALDKGKYFQKDLTKNTAEEVTPQLTPQLTPQSSQTPKNRSKKLAAHSAVHMAAHSSQTPKNRSPIITIEAKDDSKGASVLMINAKAAAGLPQNIDNAQFFEDLPRFQFPLFQFGDFALIETTGDSMHPTIYHGDWVLVKRVVELEDIKEGYVHVLVLDDGLVVKRVLNRIKERNALALQSDNETYTTYDASVDRVLQVWQVQMKLSPTLINLNGSLRKEMSQMRDDLDMLMKKVLK